MRHHKFAFLVLLIVVISLPTLTILANNIIVSSKIHEITNDNFRNNLSISNAFKEKNGFIIKTGKKVAVLNYDAEPSYFTGGVSNYYTETENLLENYGYTVDVLTDSDIQSGLLTTSDYDVLILPDNVPSDDAVDEVVDFYNSGGSIISMDSASCFLVYSGILGVSASNNHGEDIYWNYKDIPMIRIYEYHSVAGKYSVGDTLSTADSSAAIFYWSQISSISYIHRVAVNDANSSEVFVFVVEGSGTKGNIVHIADEHAATASDLIEILVSSVEWITGIPRSTPAGGGTVAILNYDTEPSYFTGGVGNDYSVVQSLLDSHGISSEVITVDDIRNGYLTTSYYSVLILPDNAPADDTVDEVVDFYNSGGSIISIDSAACFLIYSGILGLSASNEHGEGIYWGYMTISQIEIYESHDITDGFYVGQTIITSGHDDAVFYWDEIDSVPNIHRIAVSTSDSNYVYIFAVDSDGTHGNIVHITDEDAATNTDISKILINAVHWSNKKIFDTDEDGMPDSWEQTYGLDPNNPSDANYDNDGDGLTNLEEYHLGGNPNDSDTDDDGMPDGWEAANHLNLASDDSYYDNDGDGLTNLEEYQYDTDPNDSDTDDDGMPDGWEVQYYLDPTDSSDASYDSDGDGLTNYSEYWRGTNPRRSDSDGDLLSDSSDPYPTNGLLPMGPVYIIGAVAVGSVIIVRRKREEQELLNKILNECKINLDSYGFVNYKAICKKKKFMRENIVANKLLNLYKNKAVRYGSFIVHNSMIEKIKGSISDILRKKITTQDDLINELGSYLQLGVELCKQIVPEVCKEICITLPSGRITIEAYLESLISETLKLGVIAVSNILDNFPFLTKEDAEFIISEALKRNLLVESKATTGIYYTHGYLKALCNKIKDIIASDKYDIFNIGQLSKDVNIPVRDLSEYLMNCILQQKGIIPVQGNKAFFKEEHIIDKINKLFEVYEELKITDLANKFHVDRGKLEQLLVDAIAGRKINAKIKGDLLVSAVPMAAPMPAPVREKWKEPSESQETMMIPGYKPMGILGSGGFATVFKAKDPQGRIIALKILTARDSSMKKTFAREVSLWKVLEHPNIVKLLDFGVDPIPFMAMELMDGTLRQKIQEKKLPIKEALNIILQIALALEYAHKDFNIIHRDIKPENILYKEDIYKLSDWGLAGIQTVASMTTGFKGTIAYSAPEQFDAAVGRIGPWTDVWQLGVVLYELIAGELPFGSDIKTVVSNVLYGDLKPIEGIDKELWNLIESMLQKDTEKRINIVDVIKRIRNILNKY